MVDGPTQTDDPDLKISHILILILFLLGSICLLWGAGLYGGAIPTASGMAAVIAAVLISFKYGAGDFKRIFFELCMGSTLVLGATVMSFNAVELNTGSYACIGVLFCTPPLLVILILQLAFFRSYRKDRPILNCLLLLYMLLALSYALVLSGSAFHYWLANPLKRYMLAEALLYCGLAATTLGSFAAIFVNAWNIKRTARKRDFFISQPK